MDVIKTIKGVCEATGLSRFTLAQVAREGRFGKAAHQDGATWMIDMEHEDFKKWLEDHWKQARVKGEQNHIRSILVCVSCRKSVALTESEARVWRNAEEKLGVEPSCITCGGEVKVSTTNP